MSLIAYRNNQLHMEDVPLRQMAEAAGTPFYAYSRGMIEKRYGEYQAHLGNLANRTLTCYAVKANPNQAVLRVLRNAGAGADLTTGGELQRALAAGFSPDKIVFSGIGKRGEDIARALKAGIRQINVESSAELTRIDAIAAELDLKARVGIRLNPQLDSLARPDQAQITTGRPDSKFGIPWPVVMEMAPDFAQRFPHLDLAGISIHIGSNFQAGEYEELARVFRTVCETYLPTLMAQGVDVRTLDIGGGVGVDDENPFQSDNPLIESYCTLVRETFGSVLKDMPNLTLIMEPGRSLVAESGLLVMRVINVKDDMCTDTAGENGLAPRFVVVDAAMNDFARPSLYSAFHLIMPVKETSQPRSEWWNQVDICGTVCETTDSFMRSVTKSLGVATDHTDCDPDALRAQLKTSKHLKTRTKFPEEPPALMTSQAPGGGNLPNVHLASFIRRRFPHQRPGDLLAMAMTGAYGTGLASEFNSRPFPVEILVDADRFAIIRERRKIEDIIRSEPVPEWLN